MSTWDQRSSYGFALEQKISRELRLRGWSVSQWGQGVLSVVARRLLRARASCLRSTPDLIAARVPAVYMIDCKGRMTGRTTPNHAVEVAAVEAHLKLVEATNVPVLYVFDNYGVQTPYDVKMFGSEGPTHNDGSGSEYLLVSTKWDRAFDDVFGAPRRTRDVDHRRGDAALPLAQPRSTG